MTRSHNADFTLYSLQLYGIYYTLKWFDVTSYNVIIILLWFYRNSILCCCHLVIYAGRNLLIDEIPYFINSDGNQQWSSQWKCLNELSRKLCCSISLGSNTSHIYFKSVTTQNNFVMCWKNVRTWEIDKNDVGPEFRRMVSFFLKRMWCKYGSNLCCKSMYRSASFSELCESIWCESVWRICKFIKDRICNDGKFIVDEKHYSSFQWKFFTSVWTDP